MKDRKYRIEIYERRDGENVLVGTEVYTALPRYLSRMEELMRDGPGHDRHTAERTSSKVYHLPETQRELFGHQ